jgi:hypothetical protein
MVFCAVWGAAFIFAPGCQDLRRGTPVAQNESKPPKPAPLNHANPTFPSAVTQDPPRELPSDLIVRATAPQVDDSQSPVIPAVRNVPSNNAPANTPALTEAQKLRQLFELAQSRNNGIEDFVARFRRREVVNGKAMPEDLMTFKFRKAPFSVHFAWLPGTDNEGREVVYVKGLHNGNMVARSGKGDLLSGIRTEIAPNSPRVLSTSRRTIEDAGLSRLVNSFGDALNAQEKGDLQVHGRFQYVGPQQRPESATPMECVLQTVPVGKEKHLPNGGRRYWFFSTDTRGQEYGLPVLILCLDETGKEVEYYCYDRMSTNVGFKDKDFDPDVLWRK